MRGIEASIGSDCMFAAADFYPKLCSIFNSSKNPQVLVLPPFHFFGGVFFSEKNLNLWEYTMFKRIKIHKKIRSRLKGSGKVRGFTQLTTRQSRHLVCLKLAKNRPSKSQISQPQLMPCTTVDGRTPTPHGMYKTLSIMGKTTYQLVSPDL